MRRRLGDRRIKPRFDIVGELAGTLEMALRLPLRDVSPTGALVESRVALPAESVHRLTFSCDGVEAPTQVRVRHVSQTQTGDGETSYLIGVEFLSNSPALVTLINLWMAQGHGEAAPVEA